MKLPELFQQYILQHNLFSSKDQLLLAVSGGVDSVVLTDLCFKAGYNFTIAHCNFQLRGEESDADETFVSSLGRKYNVEVRIQRFDTEQYAVEHKLSIQEAARELRYDWFKEIASGQSAVGKSSYNSLPDSYRVTTHILTAHHADDNIETLLMNFFRGTGLHGLTGIPVSYGQVKRPLLSFTREELLAHAKENELQYREDSSNRSSKYTRNFFRNEIIPAISKVYPQVKENLTDNINRFKEIEQLYNFSTQLLIKKLCRVKGNEIHIPVKQLMQYNNRALIYEIIHPFGFSEKQVDELQKLAASESGKFIDSPALHFRIVKNRHWFIITPVQTTTSATIVIEEKDASVLFEAGSLSLKKSTAADTAITASGNIAMLNADEVAFPLLLRKWKTGDYFYPLGMKKKKKLARFFIDQKLSKTAKENVWVLESNKKIIWIVGQRIDDRFKITSTAKTVLKITFNAG